MRKTSRERRQAIAAAMANAHEDPTPPNQRMWGALCGRAGAVYVHPTWDKRGKIGPVMSREGAIKYMVKIGEMPRKKGDALLADPRRPAPYMPTKGGVWPQSSLVHASARTDKHRSKGPRWHHVK